MRTKAVMATARSRKIKGIRSVLVRGRMKQWHNEAVRKIPTAPWAAEEYREAHSAWLKVAHELAVAAMKASKEYTNRD